MYELQRLADNITLKSRSSRYPLAFRIETNPGASESLLRDAEAQLGIKLPPSYIELIRQSNGFDCIVETVGQIPVQTGLLIMSIEATVASTLASRRSGRSHWMRLLHLGKGDDVGDVFFDLKAVHDCEFSVTDQSAAFVATDSPFTDVLDSKAPDLKTYVLHYFKTQDELP